MRSSLSAPITMLCAVAPLFAQNPTIDFNVWTEEALNGSGPWVVDAPSMFCYSTNTVNTDVSTFASDFQVTYLEFRMSINAAAGDDDLPGFILGWQPGDGFNPATQDYVLVDWKRLTQTYQDWGTANEGLALSHVQGSWSPGYGGAPIDLWSHTGVCTELARGNTYGTTGWAFDTNYYFRVIYTPSSVDIWVNDQLEFSVTGTFNPGRFACYNFSQSRTEFQFPIAGGFNPVGTGCAGSEGTPYLFSPVTPYVGETLPLIVADVPSSSIVFLVLGGSNTTWGGTSLPVNLALVGAPGCTLYNSPDVLLAMGNFNGTAYLPFPIPTGVVPSSTPAFFVQALATDFGTNPLGLIFSNGAEVVVGIR